MSEGVTARRAESEVVEPGIAPLDWPPNATGGNRGGPGVIGRLWFRQRDSYPSTGPRMVYLAIVVASTIVLYYELYVGGSVSPAILADFHMSFRYYVNITVLANAVGAFSSLLAGLADRWGRANMVTYGLLLTGLLTLLGIPHASNELTFGLLVGAVGFVEGIILVATPALVRDFSPQLGRASAMGFWTLGPVVGSLAVAEVSSHTLPHLHAWQDQFVICGIAGLAVFLVALFGLRELSPGLRDQLMVSLRDKALVEARARGIDVRSGLRHPWRQMLHLDILGPSLAIGIFLIIYYSAVGFFTIYFKTIFNFSLAQANAIGNWFWAFDAGGLIVVGIVSDRLRVRKPFMIVGALGAIAFTILFLLRTDQPSTSYYTFAAIISVLAVFLAIAYAPWMASFTETVERRNPALIATGLAVWGWVLRIVVAVSIFVLPFVVSSTTPLVDYGSQVQTLSVRYAPELKTIGAIDPTTLGVLQRDPTNTTAAAKAIGEISGTLHVSPSAALTRLEDLARVSHQAGFEYLQTHGKAVLAASKSSPGQWRNWWWVCVGAEALFVPLVFVMAGRWRPKSARRDARAHDARVEAELAQLGH